jgi:hypothetical protein
LVCEMEVVIGSVISVIISTVFYVLASRGLKKEAAELRKLTISLIHLLNNAGAVEVKEFDPDTGAPTKWSVSRDLSLRWRTEAPPEPRETPVSASEERSGTQEEAPPEQEKPVSRWRSWVHRLFGGPGEL